MLNLTRPRALILLGLLILTAIALLIHRWQQQHSTLANRIAVTTKLATRQHWSQKLIAYGTLAAHQTLEIHSERAGMIQKIYVQPGEKVTAGQALIEINRENLKSELEQAQARLARSQHQYERLQKLFKLQANSKSQLEDAWTNYQIDQANATKIQNDYDKSLITAPFAGIVGIPKVREGQLVSSSQKLLTLADASQIEIQCQIPETALHALQIGASAKVEATHINTAFQGKITAFDNQLDPATHTILANVLVENTNQQLMPGMFAKIIIDIDPSGDFVTVPLQALQFTDEGVFVVKNNDQQAEFCKVTLGQSDSEKVAILSGLPENSEIVTTGQHKLSAGDRLNILPETSELG